MVEWGGHHGGWGGFGPPSYIVKKCPAILMKTGLNNVLLPTLFIAVNNIVTPDSGSTTLFNIVDKCEQRGQQNIAQSCSATGSAFFAV